MHDFVFVQLVIMQFSEILFCKQVNAKLLTYLNGWSYSYFTVILLQNL